MRFLASQRVSSLKMALKCSQLNSLCFLLASLPRAISCNSWLCPNPWHTLAEPEMVSRGKRSRCVDYNASTRPWSPWKCSNGKNLALLAPNLDTFAKWICGGRLQLMTPSLLRSFALSAGYSEAWLLRGMLARVYCLMVLIHLQTSKSRVDFSVSQRCLATLIF